MSERKKLDAHSAALLASIERGLEETARSEYGAIHTPDQILARRKAGRPRGSVQAVTKKPVQIRLDEDVLAALRGTGDGWQTRINDTLRASLALAGKL